MPFPPCSPFFFFHLQFHPLPLKRPLVISFATIQRLPVAVIQALSRCHLRERSASLAVVSSLVLRDSSSFSFCPRIEASKNDRERLSRYFRASRIRQSACRAAERRHIRYSFRNILSQTCVWVCVVRSSIRLCSLIRETFQYRRCLFLRSLYHGRGIWIDQASYGISCPMLWNTDILKNQWFFQHTLMLKQRWIEAVNWSNLIKWMRQKYDVWNPLQCCQIFNTEMGS